MRQLIRDLRYGWRRLVAQPAFAIVAVVTLALGIGANTAIFSVVNAVLLKPLPYPHPEQLMLMGEGNPQRGLRLAGVSPRTYRDWTAQSTSFAAIGAYQFAILSYTGPDGAVRLNASSVTSNVMSLLGVTPLAGRVFDTGDDDPSRPEVAVLSEGIWERQFGRDRGVIGRVVSLNKRPYVVVGVLPKAFDFPLGGSDAWTLLAFAPQQLQSRGFRSLNAIGRLKVTEAQAQAEMSVLSARYAQSDPATSGGWTANVTSLYENLVANVRPSLLMLQGAVLFVLLIACVNVAALVSARMAARQREVGLRTALGASRGGLIRQMLTESVLLGVAGGVGGIALAFASLRALVAAIPPGALPRSTGDIGLDWRVFLFTLALGIGTGVLFGLLPAVQSTRTVLTSVLADSGRRTSASRGQRAFRSSLVILEVTLSLVLLVGAGLLMRTFIGLSRIDPGFRSEGVLVNSQLVLPAAKYGQDFRGNQFFTDLLDRLGRIPGIESAGGITALPLQGNSRVITYAAVGQSPRAPGSELQAAYNVIAGDYFKTMSIPLEAGRLFTARDDRSSPHTAIVNDTLARQVFAHDTPIGKHLAFGSPAVDYEIVGMVGSTRQFGLTTPPQPEIFTSYLADPITYMYVLTKSTGDPARLIPAIRQEVRNLDPDQPVGHRTLAQQFENSIADSRFYTVLLGLFGGTALVLAAVGIYGVMSYVVAQRTREFGIRLALGADAGHVRGLVLNLGLRLVAVGIVVGLGLSWALTRYLGSQLYGVTATDATTFAGVAALLGTIAMIAGYLPARRAMRVAPVVALRAE